MGALDSEWLDSCFTVILFRAFPLIAYCRNVRHKTGPKRLVAHAFHKKSAALLLGNASLGLTLECPNRRDQLNEVAGIFRWDQGEWPQGGREGYPDRRLTE